ncbi:MAG: bacterio-opsin activator domain-containing protein [Halobacteriaceae archaeon]
MSVIATIRMSADEFLLGAALAADPDLRVELERVVPVGDVYVPYLFVSDGNPSSVTALLEADDAVASCRVVDAVDSGALIRVEWARDADALFTAIAEATATLLEAVGENGVWRFQLRFEDADDLTAFYRQCVDAGVDVGVESIHNPGVPRQFAGGSTLTDTQRETLCVALSEGYYEVPRRINLVELAERLDVSDTAVSQRLRRATAAILADVLADVED